MQLRATLEKYWPECILAAIACVVFLACLGSIELWGKREQRAVAESIDTVDHNHWLVAEIQSRPRLEKPPLPRWISALLILSTGQRDEWLLRLPAALCALGMVALTYSLGTRLGGRTLGLFSGLALCSILYFVVELRQAGNDGPLAFFVTLAIYAAWRRLHRDPLDPENLLPATRLGHAGWSMLLYIALGLGFLCKGPIALIVVALALLPYLAFRRRLLPGIKALANGWGLLLMVALILSWPVPVLLNDPKALDVWLLEMGQKAGTAGIAHHRSRNPLFFEWGSMTAPWTIFATLGVVLPLLPRGRELRPAIALPWSWVVVNLAMFSAWSVAKPNYFLPCLPGVALISGRSIQRIARLARSESQAGRKPALRLLIGHWAVLGMLALAAPFVVARLWPAFLIPCSMVSAGMLTAVIASYRAWQRGNDFIGLAGVVGAFGLLVMIAYGVVGPAFNASNSHRLIAQRVAKLIPPEQKTVMFYRELDEGLWYYLRGHELKPVPGSQPRYNKGLDLLDDFRAKRLIFDDRARLRAEAQTFLRWLDQDHHESPFVLMRAEVYDLFADDLAQRVRPILREEGVERNALMLVQVAEPADARHAAAAALPANSDALKR